MFKELREAKKTVEEFLASQKEVSDEQKSAYESARTQCRFTLLKTIEQLQYLEDCYVDVIHSYIPVLMEIWEEEFKYKLNINVEEGGVRFWKV